MKPKYIFSAVFAVCTLLAILLPGMGARRVKTAGAFAPPAATLAPLPVQAAAAQAATGQLAAARPAAAQPTLAPFNVGATAQAAADAAPSPAANSVAAPVLPPPAAPAQDAPDVASIPSTALPGLQAFAASFNNAPTGQVAGAYVQGVFALPVIQQPSDNPDFVSPDDNVLTQFVKPERFNVIGLLAHDYLSGRSFAQLQSGQEIYVIYGGGQTARFRVTGFQHYQAVDSQDNNTDYVDLDDPQSPVLTQQQVFTRAYTGAGQLVLQTCIEKNGDYSWGRLFVLASPE